MLTLTLGDFHPCMGEKHVSVLGLKVGCWETTLQKGIGIFGIYEKKTKKKGKENAIIQFLKPILNKSRPIAAQCC